MSNVPVKPFDAESHPPQSGVHPSHQQQFAQGDVQHFKQMKHSMGGGFQDNLDPKAARALVKLMDQMADRIKSSSATPAAAIPPAREHAVITGIKAQFADRFSTLANDSKAFHQLMQQAYGPDADPAGMESLRQRVLTGDFSWLPRIEVLDPQVLQGNLGAFDAERNAVYMSSAVLAQENPEMAVQVYGEEVAHALD